jgi:hypothetical protein
MLRRKKKVSKAGIAMAYIDRGLVVSHSSVFKQFELW